jgi:hypothetical protein
VAGLSSYQDRAGNPLGTYGVEEFYTRVSDYDGWIESGLKGELEPDDPKGCASAGVSPSLGWLGGLFSLCVLLRRSKRVG